MVRNRLPSSAPCPHHLRGFGVFKPDDLSAHTHLSVRNFLQPRSGTEGVPNPVQGCPDQCKLGSTPGTRAPYRQSKRTSLSRAKFHVWMEHGSSTVPCPPSFYAPREGAPLESLLNASLQHHHSRMASAYLPQRHCCDPAEPGNSCLRTSRRLARSARPGVACICGATEGPL